MRAFSVYSPPPPPLSRRDPTPPLSLFLCLPLALNFVHVLWLFSTQSHFLGIRGVVLCPFVYDMSLPEACGAEMCVPAALA